MKVTFLTESKSAKARKLFSREAKKRPQNVRRLVKLAKLERKSRSAEDAKRDMEND